MADQEQLQIVREGRRGWNKWRTENPKIPLDLSEADLEGADLNGTNLIGANLTGANLVKADLIGAHLVGANLTEANLSEANLRGAYISEASFSRAILGGANLSGTNLSGSNLYGAYLNEVNLRGADLRDVDLSSAKLVQTVFANSFLLGARGLDTCHHLGPSVLDHRTIEQSGKLPLSFLRGCGLPDKLIDYLPSILNEAIHFYSCFISYSHEDKAFARRLHDTLQGRGIRCWLDEKQLLPGDDIYDQVDRGIRLWDKVLLCCSKHSLTSWWVDAEIEKAFRKEQELMNERKKKVLALIPLDLDGFLFDGWKDGKASRVQARLAPDFRDWESSHTKCEEQIENVIRALRADEHVREKPPQSRL